MASRPAQPAQPAQASEPAGAEKPELDPLAYNIALPEVEFEGPLDLLLHLIQSHQLNILDIPMHFITERYLQYLQLMQTLSIDLASEYLVMAAVLVHIKSKMLLPTVPAEQADDLTEEELDPREELVRRLLEYQRYKSAAAELSVLADATQDVFPRPPPPPAPPSSGPLAPVPVFHLLDAFSKLLEKRKVKTGHEVTFDRLTITERINELTDVLKTRRRMSFEQLFEGVYTRFDLVITFLALLEMAKLRLTRLYQSGVYADIHIEYTVTEAGAESAIED